MAPLGKIIPDTPQHPTRKSYHNSWSVIQEDPLTKHLQLGHSFCSYHGHCTFCYRYLKSFQIFSENLVGRSLLLSDYTFTKFRAKNQLMTPLWWQLSLSNHLGKRGQWIYHVSQTTSSSRNIGRTIFFSVQVQSLVL